MQSLMNASDADMQQRTSELCVLLSRGHESLLAPNPRYSSHTRTVNPLLNKLRCDDPTCVCLFCMTQEFETRSGGGEGNRN